jgi:modulator of FtsH protease HflK
VRDAFQEVVRAKADKERRINEAEAYQNDVVPRARGERQRLIEEATGFKERAVLTATGDAERFLSVLQAYQLAPEVTRERLQIEALEDVLSRVGLMLLDEGVVGNQVLPFLPLTDMNNSVSSQPATITGASSQPATITGASSQPATITGAPTPPATTEGEQ